MLEQTLREPYQRLFVDRLAKLIKYYVNPMQITLVGGVIGMSTAIALAYQHVLLAIVLLLISGYCDTLDGTIARHKNISNPFGAVMDIIMDRSVEFAVILGLWFVQPQERSLLCLLMLGSILLCVTSFLVVGIFSKNESDRSFHYSPGIMERAEAFIFFIAMMLLPPYFNSLAILFCILVMLTTFIRVYEFKIL